MHRSAVFLLTATGFAALCLAACNERAVALQSAPATSQSAPAAWNARCLARLESVHQRAAAFGRVSITNQVDADNPYGELRLAVEVDGVAMMLFAALAHERAPDLHDGQPRKVPRIYERWHSRDDDAEIPFSAHVPRVFGVMLDEIHHRIKVGALNAILGARFPTSPATAARFTAQMKPVLDSCLADSPDER